MKKIYSGVGTFVSCQAIKFTSAPKYVFCIYQIP